MKLGNFAHELADMRAEQEREAGIAAARRALEHAGTTACVECGEEIEAERRAAISSARRCLECQSKFERQRKGR